MPVYALGSNGSGQLGVGHTHDLSIPELVPGSRSWPSIKQLAAGGNHTVILLSNGRVFAAGNNEDSRACICGRSTSAFLEMPLWEYNYGGTTEVLQVACTWSATLLLMGDGTVFVCGSGSGGELGLGEGVTNARLLKRIPNFPREGRKVVSMSACMGHVVVVLDDGSVYGWGKGRQGQIGEPASILWKPRKVQLMPFRATEVACGKDFTVVLGDKLRGQMVMLGPNKNDRFGIRKNVPKLSWKMRTLSASWGSGYFLRADGAVRSWGRDDHGQLSSNGLPEIASIAAGSEHVLALTTSGQVLAWGWGEHGNCGQYTDDRGDVVGRWNELHVPGRVTGIFAGCATSFIDVAD